jgi:hypothetical protein
MYPFVKNLVPIWALHLTTISMDVEIISFQNLRWLRG